MAIALGLLVFYLLRRRKQKQQDSNGVLNVNKTTTATTTVKSSSGSTSATPLPTSEAEVHPDLEKDHLQPHVSLASALKEASGADEVPRGGETPQKKWRRAEPL